MSEYTAPPQGTTKTATYHDPIGALPAPGNGTNGGSGARGADLQSPSAVGAEGSTAPKAPRGKAGVRVRKAVVLLVILLVVGGAIWKIYRNKQETAAAPGAGRGAAMMAGPTPVLVISVQQRTVPVYLTALGTVTAYNSVNIRSRVDGQLFSVNVREGQKVGKGQLVAVIDPRPYQAALAEAEGQLTKDQATSANASAEAGRYTALYGAGVISRESQQTQVSNAGQASGAIQADQAAIQAARVNLTYTRITSPIDGVVGLRAVDAGNIVHASDANGLILVTQVQPISIIFTLPEDQLPQVLKLTRSGAKLSVEAYDRSESKRLATGTLLTVDNQIDTTTGTARVKAVFPNTDGALFPNQFVNVRLILQQRQGALVVPTAALQTGTSGNFVYVVRPGDPPPGLNPDAAPASGQAGNNQTGGKAGKASSRAGGAIAPDTAGNAGGAPGGRPAGPKFYVEAIPVKIDLTQGSNTVLAGGVNPGDQVVVDGQERLKNGGRVIPHQTDPATGGAAGMGAGSNGINGASGTGAPANVGGAGNGSSRGGTSGPQGTPQSGQNGTGSGQSATGGRQ